MAQIGTTHQVRYQTGSEYPTSSSYQESSRTPDVNALIKRVDAAEDKIKELEQDLKKEKKKRSREKDSKPDSSASAFSIWKFFGDSLGWSSQPTSQPTSSSSYATPTTTSTTTHHETSIPPVKLIVALDCRRLHDSMAGIISSLEASLNALFPRGVLVSRLTEVPRADLVLYCIPTAGFRPESPATTKGDIEKLLTNYANVGVCMIRMCDVSQVTSWVVNCSDSPFCATSVNKSKLGVGVVFNGKEKKLFSVTECTVNRDSLESIVRELKNIK